MAENDNDRELTQKVWNGLHRIGYNKQRVTTRAKIYTNASEGATFYHRKRYCEHLEVIMTGSRREGMAGFWESDTDQLIVPSHVICVEDTEILTSDQRETMTVMQLDYRNMPNGYARLKLHSMPENAKCEDVIKDNCEEIDGELFLCNNRSLTDTIIVNLSPFDEDIEVMLTDITIKQKNLVKRTTEVPHGPARPFKLHVPVTGGRLDYDNVFALKCHSPHLDEFCDSKTGNDWPDAKVVEVIRGLDSHAVPVGVEGTQNEHLQWRISNALAEIELVKSFNDTQIKVYGLMKMISKHILEEAVRKYLQGLSGGLTDDKVPLAVGVEKDKKADQENDAPSLSYIIKNVMFWLSEEEAPSGFTEDQFHQLVVQGLRKLLVTMETGILPNYIIPSRNCCSGKLTMEYRKVLQSELKRILAGGLGEIHRIPGIKEQLADVPARRLDRQAKRRQIEEYMYLAPFAMPPEQMAEVKHKFKNAKWTIQAIWIYFHDVWPYFLKTITEDMFEEFGHRSDFRKFVHVVSEYVGIRNFYRYITRHFYDTSTNGERHEYV